MNEIAVEREPGPDRVLGLNASTVEIQWTRWVACRRRRGVPAVACVTGSLNVHAVPFCRLDAAAIQTAGLLLAGVSLSFPLAST